MITVTPPPEDQGLRISQDPSEEEHEPVQSSCFNIHDDIVHKISNFAIQYNLTALGIAIIVVSTKDTHFGSTGTTTEQTYEPRKNNLVYLPGNLLEVPEWVEKYLFGIVFGGSVMGMLVMGWFGDFYGRRMGLVITTIISTLGILMSALLTFPESASMWEILCIGRFLLGFGIGGLYPLSASAASEDPTHRVTLNIKALDASTKNDSIILKAQKVAWSFIFQSPGSMAPYFITLVVLALNRCPVTSFRIILGIGALPTAYVFLYNLHQLYIIEELFNEVYVPVNVSVPHDQNYTLIQRSIELEERKQGQLEEMAKMLNESVIGRLPSEHVLTKTVENQAQRRSNLWDGLRDKEYWFMCIGTAGCWFLFDVAFYGTSIFAPFILKTMFSTKTIQVTEEEVDHLDFIEVKEADIDLICYRSLFILFCLFCGSLTSALLITKISTFRLNTIGFCVMACAFLSLGQAVEREVHVEIQFGLLSVLLFTLGLGPNVTTYIIPVLVFPSEVRATFHGISAAIGKVGAIIGALIYPHFLAQGFNLADIMYFQMFIAILGILLSEGWLRRYDGGDSRYSYSSPE